MSLRPAGRAASLERTLIRSIFDSAPADAINLGLGQPDLPTPESICDAGVRAIAERRTGYTTTAGIPELRRAIAAASPAGGRTAEEVLVTVGSQQAIFCALLTLVEPGAEVLYPDPGYPAYPTAVRLAGAEPRPYPLDRARGFEIDVAAIEERLTERTALVLLCAPSNPTGACHPRAGLERLVRTLARRGIGWLSDEVYAALGLDGAVLSPSELAPGGGVVVSSFSKNASMTGWRVGWLEGPAEVVRRATAVHQHMVTCAPGISQWAALAAFEGEGSRAIERWRERLRSRRDLMERELSRLPAVEFARPGGGFYFFVDVSAHGSSLELAERLLSERGVVTIPGEAFGPNGAGHLRISFAAAEPQIVEGVGRLAAMLERTG